ncbi:MAG: sensor histidine kinase [Anaerolineales bacterium]|nr:sensor histidine kinase [Anaerolineales bacterium]
MKRSADSSYSWIFYLTIGCLLGATVLRSLIRYQDSSSLGQVLGVLLIWLVLLVSGMMISPRRPGYFPLYLILQSILVLVLLFMKDAEDYFAALFGILSMQIMQRFSPKSGAVWIGLFAILIALPMAEIYGAFAGIAFALIYTFGSVLLASYALATRRAQEAHRHNQTLTQQFQEANRQLQSYAQQSQQLVVARERHHLARELHDSVTQTIFTMALTTQSAMLLLDRDPGRVGPQLDRLSQLAQSALSELQVLITELRPDRVAEGGLAAAIRRHLTGRYLPEGLSVSLEVEGDQPLEPSEARGLFRIVQEALNNVVKHAQAPQARIRLHLAEAPWIEIADHGQGFDLQRAADNNRVGLASMRERAAEIGWELQITSAPDAGTRVRAEKMRLGGNSPR